MTSAKIFIERYTPADPRLGRHVEHDERSKAYPFTVAAPRKPKTVIWPDTAPVLDQGNLGGCVGWTGADILNTAAYAPIRKAANAGRYYTDPDALALYGTATHCDNIAGAYPPVDTGSSGLGLAKALKKLALIDRYTHCFTWDQFIAAISTQAVAVGTLWTTKMTTPDRNGVCHVGPLNDSTVQGGHEYMVRGIITETSLCLCRNHWTPSWNRRSAKPKLPGEFYITFADMAELLNNQGDVTVLHGAGMP